MPPSNVRRQGPAILVLVVVLAGCSQARTGSANPELTPIPGASDSASRSPEPSIPPTSEPSSTSVSPETPAPQPPKAFLAVEGGDRVEGELGSYGWLNGGSDSPWLPGAPIHVGRGERLTLTLSEDVRVETWTVSRSPIDSLGDQLVGIGDGSTDPVAFAAPPPGTWSVSVSVWFADTLGSATYYWQMTVD